MEIIHSTELFVLQVEMDVYSLAKKVITNYSSYVSIYIITCISAIHMTLLYSGYFFNVIHYGTVIYQNSHLLLISTSKIEVTFYLIQCSFLLYLQMVINHIWIQMKGSNIETCLIQFVCIIYW